MSLQVIKCKTCNRVFAACKSDYIDDEWTEECDRYVKGGNSIVEMVEPIKGENVFGDEPLNPCCGRPAVKTPRILWIGTRSEYDKFIRRSSGNVEYYLLTGRDALEASKTIRFNGYIKDDSHHNLSNVVGVDVIIKTLDGRLKNKEEQ